MLLVTMKWLPPGQVSVRFVFLRSGAKSRKSAPQEQVVGALQVGNVADNSWSAKVRSRTIEKAIRRFSWAAATALLISAPALADQTAYRAPKGLIPPFNLIDKSGESGGFRHRISPRHCVKRGS